MPKKSFTIDTFGGGVNNVGSGRDIEDNQSYNIINMNPNSESGSISMAGTAITRYLLTHSGGTVIAGICLDDDGNFDLKPGYGLFKIDSDYSGFMDCTDISPSSIAEVSAPTTEEPTEYFFVATEKHSTDGTVGPYINVVQNILGGTNGATIPDNINIGAINLGGASTFLPGFFYSSGGVRIVNGADSETSASPYWVIRRVKTDFGLHKERSAEHLTYPWESGDSPLVDHWVVNELRSTIEDAWEWTNSEQISDTARFAQPKESFGHCVESLATNSGFSAPSGTMEDSSVMFMINNHIDNNVSSNMTMNSIPQEFQLRSCEGTDVVKLQMVMTQTPGTADAGAWSFDFSKDEFYITYFHDNGIESRLTRVRPWYCGWVTGGVLDDGNNDQTAYQDKPYVDNVRWFPQTFNNSELEKDPGGLTASDFKWLGGGVSATTGVVDGIGMKLQCMIGNETLGTENGNFTSYGGGVGSMDGTLSVDGLAQGKSIKGCRLYLKSSRAYNSDSVYLMAEVDFEKGIRLNGSPKYNRFNLKKSFRTNDFGIENNMDTQYHDDVEFSDDGGRGKWLFCESDVSVLPVPVETYKVLNQVAYDDLVVPSFKTAVVLNSRTYIGNIRVRGTSYPDRMMKSSVNKYDTFSKKAFIDVVVQDADEVIHLASIGDKLLQFKRKVLHVINCQEDFEVLESSYKFAGVSSSCQVTTTDFGVIWANANGLFFYNGSKLKNLLDYEGTPLLNQSSWADIVVDTADSQVVVGYNPKTKDVIIMRQGTQKGGFIFNLYKKNIIELAGKFATYGSGNPIMKTNFVNTFDGTLVYGQQAAKALHYWDPAPSDDAQGIVLLQTKDIVFTNPSVRKTITSIYITYKASASTNVRIHADIKFIDSGEITVDDLGGTNSYVLPSTSNVWQTKRISTYFDDTAGSEKSLRSKMKNITSISLIFKRHSGTVPSSFQIDDISISYREKTIR